MTAWPSSERVALLVAHWRQFGTALNAGATEQALRETESQMGGRFPPTFRDFYANIDGMPDGVSDESNFSLWPLSRIATVAAESPESTEDGAKVVAFADFLIDSHLFYMVMSGPQAGIVVSGAEAAHAPIAPDFDRFLALCYDHPGQLGLFERPERADA